MDRRVHSLIVLMRVNLSRGLTLGEMAYHVNLTPEHLCRVFKAETGGSPARYFKYLRLLKAQELLESTHLSVKEITALVGVRDESHFVRDFERASGHTPTRYRARYVGVRPAQQQPFSQHVKIG